MSQDKIEIAFGSITGSENTDVARSLRLIIAALDDDFSQAAVIAHEVATDARGPELAHWELTISLAVTLARNLAGESNVDDTRTAIQAMLLDYEQAPA